MDKITQYIKTITFIIDSCVGKPCTIPIDQLGGHSRYHFDVMEFLLSHYYCGHSG